MPELSRVPSRPLGRVRLAFLGLGGIAVGLSALGAVLLDVPSILPASVGLLGLCLLALVWLAAYRAARMRWWWEPLGGVGVATYMLSLSFPEFGLSVLYVHLYNSALYGTRWSITRATLFLLVAYAVASMAAYGSVEAGLTNPVLLFQSPALVCTAVVMRLLYEALWNQEKLAERVEEASRMEAVGRLTGGIAHDFNNMLTAIMGSLELALIDLDDDNQLRQDLVLAKDTARRAGVLTQQLLTFSKRKVLRPIRMDVNHALREVHGMLARMAGDRVQVRYSLAPDPCVIDIDPTSFEQVVMNLVVNARDAMGDAGGEIVISSSAVHLDGAVRVQSGELSADEMDRAALSAVAHGTYVVLEVADQGRGMDRATQSKVFEPFFTTKEQGTGLGLSTVYGVVTGVGGHIDIDSAPGEGTTVRILLPLVPGEAPSEESRTPDPLSSGDSAESHSAMARILVVDDEVGVRSLMERVLERSGFDVMTAADGEEALEAFDEDGPFDLVVSDLSLPGISGDELARRLRQRDAAIPLLLTSGYSEDSSRELLETMAGEPFLEKPFGSQELIKAVARLVPENPPAVPTPHVSGD